MAINATIDNPASTAESLRGLGIVTLQLGQYEETRQALEERLAISEQLGDRQGIADAMINLGRALVTLGDEGEALRMFRDSRSIYEAIGDRWGVAIALLNQGRIMRERDEADEATNLFQQSLEIVWDIQKTSTVVQLLVEIALLWSKLDRPIYAVELLGVTLDHPAINSLYQAYADTLYADLSTQLAPDMIASALERYPTLDAAVADLLANLTGVQR